MPSFLDKLRAGSGTGSSTSGGAGKKDPKDASLSWLQKLQQDDDPVRVDGSDKFFGCENFGNTCYFNSMVQSLYYSAPFRELVLSYPARSSTEAVLNDPEGNPRKLIRETPQPDPTSPKKPATTTPTQPIKPEDKDSPDYKKKQAMANGPVLNLDYDNAEAYGMSPSLFTCLKDTFEVIAASKSRTGVLSMSRFLEMLRRDYDMFRSPMHQDAHEFLNILLNGVIEGVEKHTKELEKDGGTANGTSGDAAHAKKTFITQEESKKRYTEFQRLFQGTLTSETRCLTCENISQRDEPFLDLSVDLEQHSSVTSCLRQFSEEEMLCERDKFSCDKCGTLQEAEKRMKVKRLPRILALHLKRFKYTEDLQRLQKLFHRVVYPYHLRLFNTTNDAEDPDKLYELYAVVVHIGSGPYHGHYVSIIKTPERGWVLFDDEMVEPVDKSFVKNFFGAQIGMACAYVLFYQETTLEAVKKEQEAEAIAAARKAAEAAAPAKETKEPPNPSLGIKINGVPLPTSPTLASHDEEGARLKQVASAPAAAASQPPSAPPLSPPIPPLPATLSPGGTAVTKALTQPSSPAQTPSKADKKQAAKEEKERKAAEKEREKAEKAAEKARRKSMETRSKAQATAVRSTIITGKKPETTTSTTSGSGDGTTSTTVSSTGAGTSGTTTSAGAGGSILPAPAIPVSSPQPMASSVPGDDEIAPAPLPSVSLATGLVNTSEAAPPSTATSNTSNTNTTAPLSPKEKDKDKESAWNKPSFNSFSLRRSSRSSTGKKSKLWDRFGASDTRSSSASTNSAAGSGALVPPVSGGSGPTSNPAPPQPASPTSAPMGSMGAGAFHANASLSPQPPLPPRRSEDIAVSDTDSGTDAPEREHGSSSLERRRTHERTRSGSIGLDRSFESRAIGFPSSHNHHAGAGAGVSPMPQNHAAIAVPPIPQHHALEADFMALPRPPSNDGKAVRVWTPPKVDKPLPSAPLASGHVPAGSPHAAPGALHAVPGAAMPAHARQSMPPQVPAPASGAPPAASAASPPPLPPPNLLGTEVTPGPSGGSGGSGGGGKKRGFSSIRKKASSLLS